MKPVIIGIAGGSASGKTSISRKIKAAFDQSQSVVILRMDDYYKDQSDLDMSERVKTNYDHPFAFDIDLLNQHLDILNLRQCISKPIYDFVNHTRSNKTERIEGVDVIVLEGLMTLEDASLRKRLDIKVFVDTPADVRFIRRLVRDVKERGRTLESVVDQYNSTVRPMHEQFIEPSKRFADVIIPEGGKNEVAIDLLTTKISSIIEHNML